MIKIVTPLTGQVIRRLKVGDEVLLSGHIYTARDEAHKKIFLLIFNKKKLPFDLKNQVIYYCGPTGSPRGKIIGSCGPTTSSRMDYFTPALLEKGLRGMIGKGVRSEKVVKAIKRFQAVYFIAPSGCGAYLAQRIKKVDIIAFADLGPEAIRKLEVEDFPLIVAIDSRGRSLYGKK